MINDKEKKKPGIVKRNQVADQCNRISANANAGAFPRMSIKPTPWCAPKQTAEEHDAVSESPSKPA